MTDNIAVIGAGMIGGAIAKSLIKSKYSGRSSRLIINRTKSKNWRILGVAVTSDNRKASGKADIIFICVKPADVEKVLKEIEERSGAKL